jgi:hypothetical protein
MAMEEVGGRSTQSFRDLFPIPATIIKQQIKTKPILII